MDHDIGTVRQLKPAYELRGITYVLKPYASACVDQFPQNCSTAGVDVYTLWRILANSGINLSISLAPNLTYVWSALLNNEADIAVQSEVITAPEGSNLPQTSPVSVELPGFIVKTKFRSDMEGAFLLQKVFPWNVWLVALGLIFLSGTLQSVNQRIVKKRKLQSSEYVANESVKWEKMSPITSGSAAHMISVFWFSVQISAYGGILTIYLTTIGTKPVLPFHSLEEFSWLVYNNRCTVLTYDYVRDEFNQIFPGKTVLTSEIKQRLHKAFKRRPPAVFSPDDADTVEKQVIKWIFHNKTCVCFVDYSSRSAHWSKLSRNRLIMITDYAAQGRLYSYYYRKGLPKETRKLLLKSLNSGSPADLYDDIMRRSAIFGGKNYRDPGNQTKSDLFVDDDIENHGENVVGMGILHLTEPIIGLACGTMLGIAALMCEMFLGSRMRFNNPNQFHINTIQSSTDVEESSYQL